MMFCDGLAEFLWIVVRKSDVPSVLEAGAFCMLFALLVDRADLEWSEAAYL
jgi:hypothetical protein